MADLYRDSESRSESGAGGHGDDPSCDSAAPATIVGKDGHHQQKLLIAVTVRGGHGHWHESWT